MNSNARIRQAAKFHGHLGPYLVLGLICGEVLLKAACAKKHFGIKVLVSGAAHKPKSCIIDGLQLSTGATFGKGNIFKHAGQTVRIKLRNLENGKEAQILFKPALKQRLNSLGSHRDSEAFARKILKMNRSDLFALKIKE
jgi:formylmethanofuran dehydrogenase subunit E